MTPLAALPLNSVTWLVGSLACFVLYFRSFMTYRRSANELSKYLAWFAFTMGCGQGLLAVPSFFTLDTGILRTTYLMGEFFVYTSAVAQMAIVWCLLLRSVVPLKVATLFVAAGGSAAWLYAIPNSTLRISDNFITYRDPLFSTIVIGIMLTGLFLPAGFYFLRAATQQSHLKGILTSVVLGLVYIGVGLSTGGVELVAGQVITPISALGDLAFFSILLAVLLWPRRIKLPHLS